MVDRKNLKPLSTHHEGVAATVSSLVGTWQNELGSTMTISQVTGQSFSGTYSSAVSGGGGSVTGALAGTVAGDAVAFNVNWEPTYSSVSSWSGILLTDGTSLFIYSLWNMASTPQVQENYWESILAGSDLFFQLSPQ